jgi:hypothetical protein
VDVKGRLIQLSNGVTVTDDVYSIAKKVQDYDHNLRLKGNLNPEYYDAPYAIFETCLDGIERMVFEVWELDQRVLDRIYAADQAKNSVLLDLEGRNLLAKQNLNKRYEEKRLEAKDIIVTMLKSPKGRWKWKSDEGKLVTFDDSR